MSHPGCVAESKAEYWQRSPPPGNIARIHAAHQLRSPNRSPLIATSQSTTIICRRPLNNIGNVSPRLASPGHAISQRLVQHRVKNLWKDYTNDFQRSQPPNSTNKIRANLLAAALRCAVQPMQACALERLPDSGGWPFANAAEVAPKSPSWQWPAGSTAPETIRMTPRDHSPAHSNCRCFLSHRSDATCKSLPTSSTWRRRQPAACASNFYLWPQAERPTWYNPRATTLAPVVIVILLLLRPSRSR